MHVVRSIPAGNRTWGEKGEDPGPELVFHDDERLSAVRRSSLSMIRINHKTVAKIEKELTYKKKGIIVDDHGPP